MTPVRVERGDSPVVLAFPHSGTHLPVEIADRLNERGALMTDTDWHVDRLYAGLLPGATTVAATFHRYVIDANRPPSGESLYPGQATTDLVSDIDFDGNPIWKDGKTPDEGDIRQRLKDFHTPYHAALTAELARVKALHGVAVLYDCHSIRSEVPRLFEGRLPDFNIGTNDGRSASPALEEAVAAICARADGYSGVVNGRFKGGWTTRHYGWPATGIHAVQMELAQATHLETETPPFAYNAAKAESLRVHLAKVLETIDAMARAGRLGAKGEDA